MTNIELLFIVALFFSVYSYTVFPVFLSVLSKIVRRPWGKGECSPMVTIIISAYNEEKDIEEKVRNSLQLDYPEDKLQIIVSSDGSSDRTNEIVEGIDDKRLSLRAFTGRLGKTACLNKVLDDIQGEIVVFTDANSMFAPDMVKHLVKNFSDPDIGSVSGWTKYCNPDSGEETTGLYAKLEKKIKLDECMISSCVGADGAIFAIRTNLYVPLGANDINDFIIPLNVIKQGKRVVLDKNIFCVEATTKGVKNIYSRQVRITTRTAWAIRRNIRLLNIFKYGSFSFFLFSHKIHRLLTPFFLLSAFILNLFILPLSPFYVVTLAGQLLFWFTGLLALIGIGNKISLASICMYFLITFTAQFVGCLRMAIGVEDIMWTPKR
ncbi:Glycosyltransferase, catalytic subunit of cellulose synthase and poly-beta-1,6-N-acetylglucosamine synthase [Candidatus Electrothrix marina]|uniref:Glycosyltransferase, catalytic subunit of cellulose synthase and poly-beta-1,6-N-acetylglucosamine synthase n=1 Tax=Candidatus Electrothrix marina TaxID=1859130 RepID=A0A3S4TF53_9BACT|nr:Glycosyltransferase, catalytic subunit of cellulose synthase and poly-beta-1,6-N-acetylglucosamine synthase [Candidatus Electrothrix marina]RWX50902.1 Glycosyltransferase, catalytic subunit of cellulose synthase and poly-beta-1,6-N-acetylglucosamine synthase [Candidatus Electrothrix marina]